MTTAATCTATTSQTHAAQPPMVHSAAGATAPMLPPA